MGIDLDQSVEAKKLHIPTNDGQVSENDEIAQPTLPPLKKRGRKRKRFEAAIFEGSGQLSLFTLYNFTEVMEHSINIILCQFSNFN